MSETIMDRLRANALFKEDAREICELITHLRAELDAYRSVVTVEYDEECKEWVAEVVGLNGYTGVGDTAGEAVVVALGAAPGWIRMMFSRLRSRIAELEEQARLREADYWKTFVASLPEPERLTITEEQIDAAWGHLHEDNNFTQEFIEGYERALYDLGIVACEECEEGSGKLLAGKGTPQCGVNDCPACHGHGWVWKGVSDG